MLVSLRLLFPSYWKGTLPVILALLVGCSAAQFGAELRARPKPHKLRGDAQETLRLPQDQHLSIALPSSNRTAGLDGKAEADAGASGDGQARANASVAESGNAEGLFQLGHSFVNETERQMNLDFAIRYAYSYTAEEERESYLPHASLGLKLYARTDRGKLLRDLTLISHNTEQGVARRSGDERLDFTLMLGPGRTLNVYLAGQAKVDISSEHSASVELEVHDVQFEVRTMPAPAVMTRENEQ